MGIRRLLKTALVPMMVALVLMACGGSGEVQTPTPVVPPPEGITIEVPARPADWRDDVLKHTGIEIRKRDMIIYTAQGKWNIGLGRVGPGGRGSLATHRVSNS